MCLAEGRKRKVSLATCTVCLLIFPARVELERTGQGFSSPQTFRDVDLAGFNCLLSSMRQLRDVQQKGRTKSKREKEELAGHVCSIIVARMRGTVARRDLTRTQRG